MEKPPSRRGRVASSAPRRGCVLGTYADAPRLHNVRRGNTFAAVDLI